MADAAGLVLGVIGIIGAFKDAIDLFNIIADSRHRGRDYEILETKLDIERTLLLQWAERVNLLSANYDQRLDEGDKQELATRSLGCIAKLFTDVTTLQKRYGLEQVPPGQISATEHARGWSTVGGARWDNFVKDYDSHRSRHKFRNQSRSVTKANKLRWAIRDRDKFEKLIQDLAHFITKLNELFPPIQELLPKHSLDKMGIKPESKEIRELKMLRAMMDKDIEQIRGLRELKMLREASKGHQPQSHGAVADSTEHAISNRCKDHILNKLWFRKIDDRKESIRLAHTNTLQWALLESDRLDTDARWDDLPTWLRSGSGIYWVSGKAGSGKSTLMKHIYLSSQLRTHLSEWAGDSPCLIGNFFFMNLGTAEQKSQEGLSRTLLFQVLSENRDMIPQALPYMWKELYHAEDKNDSGDISLPSPAEMEFAFNFIASTRNSQARFCFLIDGLDEFTGNYLDGIAFINNLVQNPHIKAIVSSRPIPDCVAAFKKCPNLRLQDINHQDISLYVHDIIGRHEYMESLLHRYPVEGKQMVNEIIDKSSGVFLWVVLACRSITSGFADHDNIEELFRRLRELPPELEQMFEHMLNKTDKRHREQGARLLRLCYTHQLIAQHHGALFIPDLYTLGLGLIDEYHVNPAEIKNLGARTREDISQEVAGRLRSRCGGLLEVSQRHMHRGQPGNGPAGGTSETVSGLDGEIQSEGVEGAANNQPPTTNQFGDKVVFMHRTVFEFLDSDSAWDLECLQLPKDKPFDPSTALSLYCLHLAKQTIHFGVYDRTTVLLLLDGFRWAGLADCEKDGRPELFFDNFSSQIIVNLHYDWASNEGAGLGNLRRRVLREKSHPGEHHLQLCLAIEAGAVNYVKKQHHTRLQSLIHHANAGCQSQICLPVLYHALQRPYLNEIREREGVIGFPPPSAEMVSLLLMLGSDVNELSKTTSNRQSFWDTFLFHLTSYLQYYNEDEVKCWAKIVDLCLEAGAYPSPSTEWDANMHKVGWEKHRMLVAELRHVKQGASDKKKRRRKIATRKHQNSGPGSPANQIQSPRGQRLLLLAKPQTHHRPVRKGESGVGVSRMYFLPQIHYNPIQLR